MTPATANIFGFAGMACIIAAYAYQTVRAGPNPFLHHGTNLLGAALLTVSLLVNTNPASLVLEFFWAAIAIYGLASAFLKRGKNTVEREEGA
ncbi:MAG TPA: permease [Sphingomonadaceae bacterium]|nr:permease [Sphingomonadaceae bacterium]